MSKKRLPFVMSLLILSISCVPNQNDSTFGVKSLSNLPQESAYPTSSSNSTAPSNIKFPTTAPQVATPIVEKEAKFEVNRPELNYPTSKDSYVPGMITVI